jgi:hypothetical protein
MLQRYWLERLFGLRVVVSFRGGAIAGRAVRLPGRRRALNVRDREEVDFTELVSYRMVATFSRRLRHKEGY